MLELPTSQRLDFHRILVAFRIYTTISTFQLICYASTWPSSSSPSRGSVPVMISRLELSQVRNSHDFPSISRAHCGHTPFPSFLGFFVLSVFAGVLHRAPGSLAPCQVAFRSQVVVFPRRISIAP